MSSINIKTALEREPTARRQHVYHCTAARTLTMLQTGSVFTNLGASGSVTLTLPANIAGVKGVSFKFAVMAAQALVIAPGANSAIYIGGAKQTDAVTIVADDEGETVELISDGNGDWIAFGPVGTWTPT